MVTPFESRASTAAGQNASNDVLPAIILTAGTKSIVAAPGNYEAAQ
jgi:hypothetical protein